MVIIVYRRIRVHKRTVSQKWRKKIYYISTEKESFNISANS